MFREVSNSMQDLVFNLIFQWNLRDIVRNKVFREFCIIVDGE